MGAVILKHQIDFGNQGFSWVPTSEFQRALGTLTSIEKAQGRILDKLDKLEERLGDHINADQVALSAMRVTITDQRQVLSSEFEKQSDDRNKRLNAQDEHLEEIMRYISWAKGASWPILGLLGLIGAVMIGVLVTLVQTWLKLGKG